MDEDGEPGADSEDGGNAAPEPSTGGDDTTDEVTDGGDVGAQAEDGDAPDGGDAETEVDTDLEDGETSEDVDEGGAAGSAADATSRTARTRKGTSSGVPARPRSRPDRKRSDRQQRRSKKGRRRRLTPTHGAIAVTLLLLAGWVAMLVNDDGRASGWDWIVLGVLIAAFLGSVYSLLDQQGRLLAYRNRGLGALALCLSLSMASLITVIATGATPQLGLDLQGGFSVVLSPDGDPPSDNIDKAMEIIRQRIDGLGVAEPEVTRQGDNVVVELPGVDDREKAQQLVGRTAKLEFRPVLQAGLPFDEKAAAKGDDPCAAAAPEGAGEPTPTGDTTITEPGATPSTTPGDTSSTTAPSTTAPDTTGDAEGAGPIGPAAVIDGDNALAPLDRQTDSTTTPSTPPSTPAEGTTTTTAPAGEEGQGEAESGTVIYPMREDEGVPRTCVAMGPVGLEGDSLSKSKAELGGTSGSEWIVSVNIKGSRQDDANTLFNSCFEGDPAACPSKQLAIVLDGVVQSAPTVNDQNLASDQFQISGGEGGFPQSEAKDLASVLRYGALPVEFTPSAERRVSPTLGENSLRAGILAGVIGLVAVFIYLLFYYRALGLVVLVGIAVWASLMYGVVCWLSASRGLTLSLAGVVGIVVSLGTTVDSYIVHFERLKDEVRLGKSVRASADRGFQRAFRTILTADLASLLGASLLWWLTIGSVRGFAFFLGLSILLDLFVAYCFDRPVVALLARSEFFTENPFFGVARGLGRASEPRPAPAAAVART